MCSLFKKPKVVSAPVAADAPILRNPYLDGLDAVVRARQGGVRSLTIRRTTGTQATTGNPTITPVPTTPTTPTPTPGRLTDKQRNLATAWASGNEASPFARLGNLMLSKDVP